MTGLLTHLGTATCLLTYGDITVLTDPNFLHRGQRAYLGKGMWSRRLTEPALQPAQLPPLDVVVLSHLHGDHFDRVARRELDRGLPVVTTRQAARALRRKGFAEAVALDTWQRHEVVKRGSRLRITSAPAEHAHGLLRSALPEVMGSVLQFTAPGEPDLTVYVTGDTLLCDGLEELHRRHPALDVALFHLGGTRIPFGHGALVTMDGSTGADLLGLLRPHRTVPVHHDDYPVFRSPRSAFLAEAERRGLGAGIRPLDVGVPVPLPLP